MHVKRSSIQRHLNSFDIKLAELNPNWLQSLTPSMLPLFGKPAKILDVAEDVKEARKKELSGFAFAKFAATYFQARQIASYSSVCASFFIILPLFT